MPLSNKHRNGNGLKFTYCPCCDKKGYYIDTYGMSDANMKEDEIIDSTKVEYELRGNIYEGKCYSCHL